MVCRVMEMLAEERRRVVVRPRAAVRRRDMASVAMLGVEVLWCVVCGVWYGIWRRSSGVL